ncbi:hypothetical protein NLJ89_g8536 [Agrocybe chaxingu]|uniref:Uncharacterized protein n=1 Tax=Agrocybe chaxingu TaxID=84603 RepID=A0A9W8JV28_9AGAR|nr:hypothetical protein NLJ89_g8536 [Agrocybe chaxingu]
MSDSTSILSLLLPPSHSSLLLPPPSSESGTGMLNSAVPIPTSWPSIPPVLVSVVVDQNAGAPSPIDVPLPTPARSSSSTPPDGTDPDIGHADSPSSLTGSLGSSSLPSVGSTPGTSPNTDLPTGGDAPASIPGPTASLGLQSNPPPSVTTPLEDIPQSTSMAGRAHPVLRRFNPTSRLRLIAPDHGSRPIVAPRWKVAERELRSEDGRVSREMGSWGGRGVMDPRWDGRKARSTWVPPLSPPPSHRTTSQIEDATRAARRSQRARREMLKEVEGFEQSDDEARTPRSGSYLITGAPSSSLPMLAPMPAKGAVSRAPEPAFAGSVNANYTTFLVTLVDGITSRRDFFIRRYTIIGISIVGLIILWASSRAREQ